MDIEIGEVRRWRVGRQRPSQPVSEAVGIDERAEPIAQPRIGRGLGLLEAEADVVPQSRARVLLYGERQRLGRRYGSAGAYAASRSSPHGVGAPLAERDESHGGGRR